MKTDGIYIGTSGWSYKIPFARSRSSPRLHSLGFKQPEKGKSENKVRITP
jgi:hypothetical protein